MWGGYTQNPWTAEEFRSQQLWGWIERSWNETPSRVWFAGDWFSTYFGSWSQGVLRRLCHPEMVIMLCGAVKSFVPLWSGSQNQRALQRETWTSQSVWVNCNDLTVLPHWEWWIVGVTIPKWPGFRSVNFCDLPRTNDCHFNWRCLIFAKVCWSGSFKSLPGPRAMLGWIGNLCVLVIYRTCIYIYIHMYLHICMHMCIYVYVCIHMQTNICIYTYMNL